MSFEDDKEKNEIERLVEIHSTLKKQYHDKKEQLERLNVEIEELNDLLNQINKLIAGKSFTPASKLLDAEEIFKEGIGAKGTGTLIKRKVFSSENKLLCVLKFKDFKDVEIKIVDPKESQVKEQSEIFISNFVKQILVKIKEKEPSLDMKIKKHEKEDFIETIIIQNVNKLENFDLIELGIRRVLEST